MKFAFQNRLGWPYSWKEIYLLALFYFLFEGNFQVKSPGGGGFYLEGQCNGGFFALRVWRAYTRRGLFSEFYCIFRLSFHICISCVLYLEDQRYEIHVQSTPALRTPRYYGQFSWSPGKESSYIFSKFTPLKRTLSMSPSVSVLTGFDCIFITSRLGYVKLNQSTSPC